jgi:acyl dehydratase
MSHEGVFRQQLDGLVGKPAGPGGPSVAPDPVNQAMIRHWAAAFEDRNPVYTDPAFAAASRFGGIVAPPCMLQTWTMATAQITGIGERGGSPVEVKGPNPLSVLDDAGFHAS